jgi:hypothetical protein
MAFCLPATFTGKLPKRSGWINQNESPPWSQAAMQVLDELQCDKRRCCTRTCEWMNGVWVGLSLPPHQSTPDSQHFVTG